MARSMEKAIATGYLTTSQVAALCQVEAAQTIINWTEKGMLECARVGAGPRKYKIPSVVAFLRKNSLEVPPLLERLA